MKTEEKRIKEAAKRLGNDVARIAHNLGIQRHVIRRVLGVETDLPARPDSSKPRKPKVKIRSLAEFAASHDYTAILRAGISTHLAEGYITDSELRNIMAEQIPTRFWRETADSDEFDANRFRHEGKMLWSTAANIRAMKRAVGLAT